ncbi:branched-chain amino acid ABC transporter substrate-binding protein [Rhizobium sp. KVB221]|uniref:Branched-chain amino acid ABC transporter substrate-binding protein n=1 Tax=Rhizobium setariae TaxID=2801340 RepID=A0A937CMH2_9HYPH|nr:branched-chain amino acid ABC transporter substrate-binding protein [Rhizobium setariae]MBL0372741.1 branched-chain amino acid ABC transporter substrate-binding protein [Rhizobium setariae]
MSLRRLSLFLVLSILPSIAYGGSLKIAVVAPQAGNLAILGAQIVEGAQLAAGDRTSLVIIDESCAENSGAALAEKIRQAQAVAAIGFLCTDSLEGALPTLTGAAIPAITLSVRSSILMEDAIKKGWPLFRLAPSPTAEREKIIEAIFENWKDQPFAILDDGTITSRETAETIREALEQKGMKAAFIDNFRPAQEVQTQLIRRLAKAGVTHVFAAADRNDMSIMARDSKAANLPMVFMGGDALNAADQLVPLEKGVFAVTLPDYATFPFAKAAYEALKAKEKPADGYVLPAHAAVTILTDAYEIASGSGAPLTQALVETPFETTVGPIMFTGKHELATNPFVLLQWNGSSFVSPAVTE